MGWAQDLEEAYASSLTFENLIFFPVSVEDDNNLLLEAVFAELAYLKGFFFSPTLAGIDELVFAQHQNTLSWFNTDGDISLADVLAAELLSFDDMFSKLFALGAYEHFSHLAWGPLRSPLTNRGASFPSPELTTAFFQINETLADISLPEQRGNAVYGAAIKPSLRTHTFNGDLFSAAWELRQLWLTRQTSFRVAQHFAAPHTLDLASLEGNDLDKLIGLELFPFVRELIRLEIEDTFYLASVLFGDTAFSVKVFFGYDVVAAFDKAVRPYLPAILHLQEAATIGGAPFAAQKLTALLSPVALTEAFNAALFAPLFKADNASAVWLYVVDVLRSLFSFLGLSREEAVAAALNPAGFFGALTFSNSAPVDKLVGAVVNPATVVVEVAAFLDEPVVET